MRKQVQRAKASEYLCRQKEGGNVQATYETPCGAMKMARAGTLVGYEKRRGKALVKGYPASVQSYIQEVRRAFQHAFYKYKHQVPGPSAGSADNRYFNKPGSCRADP
jgi:hypothetical protein